MWSKGESSWGGGVAFSENCAAVLVGVVERSVTIMVGNTAIPAKSATIVY